ncbi:MAG: hypothetical protein IT287_06290 [Bdellovibrionaceae bacterium]|nr:hypothetical protein [Pseudobdellovibrionaceae bacterium]
MYKQTVLFLSTLVIVATGYAKELSCPIKVTSVDSSYSAEYKDLSFNSVAGILQSKGYKIAERGEDAFHLKLDWSFNGNNELMEWVSDATVDLSYKAEARSAFENLSTKAPGHFVITIFSETDSRSDDASAVIALEVLGRLVQALPTCQEAREQLNESKREFFKRYSLN